MTARLTVPRLAGGFIVLTRSAEVFVGFDLTVLLVFEAAAIVNTSDNYLLLTNSCEPINASRKFIKPIFRVTPQLL